MRKDYRVTIEGPGFLCVYENDFGDAPHDFSEEERLGHAIRNAIWMLPDLECEDRANVAVWIANDMLGEEKYGEVYEAAHKIVRGWMTKRQEKGRT